MWFDLHCNINYCTATLQLIVEHQFTGHLNSLEKSYMQSYNWWQIFSSSLQLHCRFTSQTILQWWTNSPSLCEYSVISQLLLCVAWTGFKLYPVSH